jgi:hypothetical protein
MSQTITAGFQSEGFKTEVQPLSHFQEDYGLKADGEEEELEEEYEEYDGASDESGMSSEGDEE